MRGHQYYSVASVSLQQIPSKISTSLVGCMSRCRSKRARRAFENLRAELPFLSLSDFFIPNTRNCSLPRFAAFCLRSVRRKLPAVTLNSVSRRGIVSTVWRQLRICYFEHVVILGVLRLDRVVCRNWRGIERLPFGLCGSQLDGCVNTFSLQPVQIFGSFERSVFSFRGVLHCFTLRYSTPSLFPVRTRRSNNP